MINNAELGHAIRTKRVERNITQSDLAKLCGCTSNYINSVEAGRSKISIQKANEILQKLGCTIYVKLTLNEI